MNDKVKFMLNAIWVAIICIIFVAGVGLIWGSVIEGTLFAEIVKYAVTSLGNIVVLGTIWYAFGQVTFHCSDDYKKKYGEDWFWQGIKEDVQYIKDIWSWKKFWKVILAYVIFFCIFGLIIFFVS